MSSSTSSAQSAVVVTVEGNTAGAPLNNMVNYCSSVIAADGGAAYYYRPEAAASQPDNQTPMNGNNDNGSRFFPGRTTNPGEFTTAPAPSLVTATNNTSTFTGGHEIKYSSGNDFKKRPPKFITLPYFLFDLEGKVPKNEEEAAKFWKWRLDRPNETQLMEDPSAANGSQMIKEMTTIKKSLENDLSTDYTDAALHWAKHYGLKMPNTNQYPKSHADLLLAVGELTDKGLNPHPSKPKAKVLASDRSNFLLFYNVFYKHFTRQWLVERVDGFAYRNGYTLVPDVVESNDQRRKNHFEKTRGGFAAVARGAKSRRLRSYRTAILKKCGWTVATTTRHKLGGHQYFKVEVPDGQQHLMYVVEATESQDEEKVLLLL